MDIYSLLPAFTLASFLIILLWPENIAYRTRLRLFMVILIIWIGWSSLAMAGYGIATDNRTACLINVIVGGFGWIAVYATYRTHPSRPPQTPPTPKA